MIVLKRITPSESGLWHRVEQLYSEAFPPEERRTTERMRALAESGRLRVGAVVRGGEFCGFITWWDFGEFVYGEHFAVLPGCRGGGIGGEVIDAFTAMADGRMVVIEVELPTGELERRRIGFYERHGFAIADFAYMQPPYEAGYDSLPLHIMTHGARLTVQEFERVRKRIYEEVYGVME